MLYMLYACVENADFPEVSKVLGRLYNKDKTNNQRLQCAY